MIDRMLRHPWVVIGVTAAVTVFFAAQLPRVEIDNNNLRFVPEHNEARRVSAAIDEEFSSSLFVLVALQRPWGDVFDPAFLRALRGYVEEVESMELIGKVNSIVTSDYITAGEEASIVVENLVAEDFSGSPAEIAALKRRLLSWDMYNRSLVSDDFTATQIIVPINVHSSDAGKPEVAASYLKIRDMAKAAFAGQAEVYVSGIPVISATISEAIKKDLVVLIPLVAAVVLFTIWIPLRRVGFVLLSILAVLVAVICSLGAMPLLGVKLSVITTVMPVVLIAVGNSYGLHVIVHYIEEAAVRGADFAAMTREEHRQFVLRLARGIAKPVFLACVTTIVSFASFCVTEVVPIREFGIFSSLGVAVSFIAALTLIPALLVVRGPKALRGFKREGASSPPHHQVAAIFMRMALRRKIVITLTALLAGASVVVGSHIIIDNVFVEYFRANTEIVKADAFIRAKFGGSKALSVVVRAASPERLLEPDVLGAVDGLETYLTARFAETGKVIGFTTLVKRINQVFNAGEPPEGLSPSAPEPEEADEAAFGFADFGAFDAPQEARPQEARAAPSARDAPLTYNGAAALLDEASSVNPAGSARDLAWEIKRALNYEGAAYYEIPADPARYGKRTARDLSRLVSNYLVLLSGSIGDYANDPLEPTAIRTLVQLRVLGQIDTDRVLDAITAYTAANLPPDVSVTVGGPALVEQATNTLVVNSVWQSMSIAAAALFLILALVNRSVLAGLLGVLPLLVLVIVNLAVMAAAGIKLNVGTALIFSLTMGIGIDYTIHFLEAYKSEFRKRKAAASVPESGFLRRAYLTSGVAILVDAASTGAGFLVLLLSQFTMLAEFGFLVAASLTLSALVGLVLIPALLMLVRPRFIEGARHD